MKRFILILSLIALALTFTACIFECAHEYGEWTVTKPATCIEEGVQTRVCALCSAEATSFIEKTEHSEVYDNSINPTCTESGLSWGKHCSVCGLVTVEQTASDPLGHNMSNEEVVIEATCMAEGELVRYCDRCDYEEHAVIEKTDHKPGVIYMGFPSTCLKRGMTDGARCLMCGEMYKEMEPLPPVEHIVVIDKGYPATESSEGLTDGQHCSLCNSVLVPQKTILRLGSTAPSFASGYVTKNKSIISTKHFDIIVDANVFVPDNLVEIVDVFTTAIEELSGLHFKEDPIRVEVIKDNSVMSEAGAAYGGAFGAVVSPIDIIDCYALVHESLHTLHLSQSGWFYNIWAMEGITTYTTYKLRLYIEENYPDLVEYIGTHNNDVTNFEIYDYDLLYAHPMDYWIDNVLEGPNNNYSIGFRLMWFLDLTYGNYVDWIYRMEEEYPMYLNSSNGDILPKEKQLEAFYMAYGDDVFDKFYDWLKDNEDICSEYRPIDLRGASSFNSYPLFYAWTEWRLTSMHSECILYDNLCIGLDAGKKYMTEYKGMNIDDLTLEISKSATVALYDEKGNLVKVSEGVSDSGKHDFKTISLEGVSYIQLVGEGRLDRFEIKGYK